MDTASSFGCGQDFAGGSHELESSGAQEICGSQCEPGLKPGLIGERQALKRKLERAEVVAFDGVLERAFQAFFGFAFAIPGGSDQLFSGDGFGVGGSFSRFQVA